MLARFLCSPAGDDPGTPWTVSSSDGAMKVTDLVATNIAVENFPCPTGFEVRVSIDFPMIFE